jgi:hypothetical protein
MQPRSERSDAGKDSRPNHRYMPSRRILAENSKLPNLDA